MKILFLFFALLAAVLLISPVLNKSENTEIIKGLPWQIDVLDDGSTQVFGLHLGVSSLADALTILGEGDVKLAIIAAGDELGSLEMYYGHFKAGVIAGKLVIQTNASEERIEAWRANAVKFEYMATGKAKKYTLSDDDLAAVLAEKITGLTFIPSANLDEEIIQARFGVPAQRVELDDTTHFLYPEKGLDIAIFENAKEVMQYVLPNNFKKIESLAP